MASSASSPIASSPSSSPSYQLQMEKQIKSSLKQHGYFNAVKVSKTLQGSIWSSCDPDTKEPVVIKVCSKRCHQKGVITIKNKKYRVQENIFKERALLKYLTAPKDAPKEIVKYETWFVDEFNYYLVMEHGGHSLFDFVQKVHEYIKIKKIDIAEWHKMVRILFKQMVRAVDHLHSHNVANFDISLENLLISDVDVSIDEDGKLSFVVDDEQSPVQLKMCDLGLAELFPNDVNGNPVWTTGKNAGKHNYKSPEMVSKAKSFSAAQNDIWCLGVTLYMMVVGGHPFKSAHPNDPNFKAVVEGHMAELIAKWRRSHYVNEEVVELMQSMLRFEDERLTINQLKRHSWLQ